MRDKELVQYLINDNDYSTYNYVFNNLYTGMLYLGDEKHMMYIINSRLRTAAYIGFLVIQDFKAHIKNKHDIEYYIPVYTRILLNNFGMELETITNYYFSKDDSYEVYKEDVDNDYDMCVKIIHYYIGKLLRAISSSNTAGVIKRLDSILSQFVDTITSIAQGADIDEGLLKNIVSPEPNSTYEYNIYDDFKVLSIYEFYGVALLFMVTIIQIIRDSIVMSINTDNDKLLTALINDLNENIKDSNSLSQDILEGGLIIA